MGSKGLTRAVSYPVVRGLPRHVWWGWRDGVRYLLAMGLVSVGLPLVLFTRPAWAALVLPRLHVGFLVVLGLLVLRLVVRLWRAYPLLRAATREGRRLGRGEVSLAMWRGVSVTYHRGKRQYRVMVDELPRLGGGYLTELLMDASGLWPPGRTLEVATADFDAADRPTLDREGLERVPPKVIGAPAGLVVLASDEETARRVVDPDLTGRLAKLKGAGPWPGACLTVTDETASLRLVCRLGDHAAVKRLLGAGEELFDGLFRREAGPAIAGPGDGTSGS